MLLPADHLSGTVLICSPQEPEHSVRESRQGTRLQCLLADTRSGGL